MSQTTETGEKGHRFGHEMALFYGAKKKWEHIGANRNSNEFWTGEEHTVIKSANCDTPKIAVYDNMFSRLDSVTVILVDEHDSAAVYRIPKEDFENLKKHGTGAHKDIQSVFYTDEINRKYKPLDSLTPEEVREALKGPIG